MTTVGILASAAAPQDIAALTPSAGVQRLDLGGRQLLFCERRQQLFELDTGTAAIWDGLATGATPQALADDLSRDDQDPQIALQTLRAHAETWAADGWLVPAALDEALQKPATQALTLRLLNLAVRLELRLDKDDPLFVALQQAFGQFAGEALDQELRLGVVAVGGRYAVLRDGASLGLLHPEKVVPEVKAAITDELCHRPADGGLFLHAAMVTGRNGALLLAGAPGAGKTTLVTALTCGRLGYVTDDLVFVSRAGDFRGVAFSPALKTGAWPLLSHRIPGVLDLPVHQRADGQAVRYLPLDRLQPGVDLDPICWVLLDRQEGAVAALEPLDPVAALTHLIGEAYAADHRLHGETLERLAEVFSRIQCRRLIYADLDEAVKLLETIADA